MFKFLKIFYQDNLLAFSPPVIWELYPANKSESNIMISFNKSHLLFKKYQRVQCMSVCSSDESDPNNVSTHTLYNKQNKIIDIKLPCT